jgi:hypothetical protein
VGIRAVKQFSVAHLLATIAAILLVGLVTLAMYSGCARSVPEGTTFRP